jgi:hypothetical protein
MVYTFENGSILIDEEEEHEGSKEKSDEGEDVGDIENL